MKHGNRDFLQPLPNVRPCSGMNRFHVGLAGARPSNCRLDSASWRAEFHEAERAVESIGSTWDSRELVPKLESLHPKPVADRSGLPTASQRE